MIGTNTSLTTWHDDVRARRRALHIGTACKTYVRARNRAVLCYSIPFLPVRQIGYWKCVFSSNIYTCFVLLDWGECFPLYLVQFGICSFKMPGTNKIHFIQEVLARMWRSNLVARHYYIELNWIRRIPSQCFSTNRKWRMKVNGVHLLRIRSSTERN